MRMEYLFAVYHDTKTAADMVDGLAVLDSILGKSLFEQEAHITPVSYTHLSELNCVFFFFFAIRNLSFL